MPASHKTQWTNGKKGGNLTVREWQQTNLQKCTFIMKAKTLKQESNLCILTYQMYLETMQIYSNAKLMHNKQQTPVQNYLLSGIGKS
mgnify:CR=1 FL=1